MFELQLTKEAFLTPLCLVAGAVDKKTSAMLSQVLLSIAQDHITLLATDLEMEITAYVPLNFDQALANKKVTLPAKKCIDIVRSLEEGAALSLIFQDKGIILKSGRSQFKLASLPADDFPSSKNEPSQVEFSLPRSQLMELLQSTQFALSQNDVRIFLNALLIELLPNQLIAVATDAHRMAIYKQNCPSITTQHRFLLPRKSVQELLKLLVNVPDEMVNIVAGEHSLKFSTTKYVFRSKLLENRFPPYIKAIPKHQNKFVVINREALKRSLNRIVILAHEKSRAILMQLQKTSLSLIAHNQEQEEALEVLDATLEGEALDIGLNANYLLDVLNHIQEPEIKLSLATTDSSILVEPVGNACYQYIIMPMKL